MEAQKVTRFLAVAASIGVLAVYGCGRDGGSGTTATTTTTTTTVSTAAQAQSSGSAATSSTTLSAGLGTTLSSIAAPAGTMMGTGAPRYRSPLINENPLAKAINGMVESSFANNTPLLHATSALKSAYMAGGMAPTTIPATPLPCTTGSASVSGTIDTTAMTMALTMTYTNCNDGTQTMDGAIYMSINYTKTTTVTGGTYTLVTGKTISGTTPTGDLTITIPSTSILAMNLTMTGSSDLSTKTTTVSPTDTLTIDGTIKYTDSVTSANSGTITCTKFKETVKSTLTAATATALATYTYNMTMDGGIKEDWTPTGGSLSSVSITFTTFALTSVTDRSTYEDITASGTIATAVLPATLCQDGIGTFTIATPTAVRYNIAKGYTTSGHQIINTDQVDIVYNSTGGATITLKGGTAITYTNGADFKSSCTLPTTPTTM